MNLPKNTALPIVLALSFVSLSVQAQCPYTSPPFNRAQVTQLCNERAAQQAVLKSLSDRLAKMKIEMITVKANANHHVGNIYAVLVGGSEGGSGGVLVPMIPAGVTTADQSVGLSAGISNTCSVVLHFNQQQDYFINNNCGFAVKAVVFFSDNPVQPQD
jgi:hypothetical protein